MPSFIVPMAVRYVLISVAMIVGLAVITLLLVENGYLEKEPSSLNQIIVMAAALWAGSYFSKQAGRPAEWRECFRIGAVLIILQTALGAVITVLLMVLPGGGLAELSAKFTPGFLAIVVGMVAITSLMYWLLTAFFFRMGSKTPLKTKKV